MKHIVSSSNGESLNFPEDELFEEYKVEERNLLIRTYIKLRNKYGIWASNQGIFVKNREDLNELDSKVMENLYNDYQ